MYVSFQILFFCLFGRLLVGAPPSRTNDRSPSIGAVAPPPPSPPPGANIGGYGSRRPANSNGTLHVDRKILFTLVLLGHVLRFASISHLHSVT